MPVPRKLAKRVLSGTLLWDFGSHAGYRYRPKGARREKIFICIRDSDIMIVFTEDQFKELVSDVNDLLRLYKQ